MNKCPNCGNESNSKFCPQCGIQMTDVNEDTFETSKENEAEAVFSNPTSNDEQIFSSVEPKKEKLVDKSWFIILLLIIFWPVGLVIMWVRKKWSKRTRIIITAIIAALMVIGIAMPSDTNYDSTTEEAVAEEETTEETTVEETTTEATTQATQNEFDESDYENISYDKLARNPDDYEYKAVKGSGEVIQVVEGDEEIDLRVAINGDYDDVILVAYDPSIRSSRVLEGDNITYYGTSYGTTTYESTLGGNITVPVVIADKIK